MFNKVTALSFFTTTEGVRIAIRYSVINSETGEIVESNKRLDRVVINQDAIEHYEALLEYAQSLVDAQ